MPLDAWADGRLVSCPGSVERSSGSLERSPVAIALFVLPGRSFNDAVPVVSAEHPGLSVVEISARNIALVVILALLLLLVSHRFGDAGCPQDPLHVIREAPIARFSSDEPRVAVSLAAIGRLRYVTAQRRVVGASCSDPDDARRR
jgi:hypothetical protein